MKVIRESGENKCERKIDFSRPIRFYDEPVMLSGKGFGIPVLKDGGIPSEIYFWDHETVRATVGEDRYELAEDNPYAYEQLKNNVELLFALHGL